MRTATSRKIVGKKHATIPKAIVRGFKFTVFKETGKSGSRDHGRMFTST